MYLMNILREILYSSVANINEKLPLPEEKLRKLKYQVPTYRFSQIFPCYLDSE